jgi:hypothetical protein
MLGVMVGAVTLLAVTSDAPFAFIGILLPTFIHVSIFTLIFMTLGAMRSGSRVQFGLIGVYIAAVAAILIVPPSTASAVPALAKLGKDYFGDIAPTLGSLFGAPDLQFAGRVTGLLSFVYTYHYLNWFIKADVIRWARIPRPRLAAIVVLSVASTAFCFYDYTLGITVLLLVSLLHVLLEFPLNSLAIRDLAGLILSHPQRGARPVRT